jgi:hypothetical protein
MWVGGGGERVVNTRQSNYLCAQYFMLFAWTLVFAPPPWAIHCPARPLWFIRWSARWAIYMGAQGLA